MAGHSGLMAKGNRGMIEAVFLLHSPHLVHPKDTRRPFRGAAVILWAMMLMLSHHGAKAAEGPEFLDAMVSSGTTTVAKYGDILTLAREKSGKKVEASDMLGRWMALDKKVGHWTAFDGRSMPLRSYFNMLTFLTDMEWRWDEGKETFFFDFAWNRPSDKPAKELLETVLASTPPPLDYGLRERMADDAWRVAFDGLICKSDKADGAWKTRAEANASRMRNLSPGAVNFLCAGKIFDEEGREFAMIATLQPMQMSPGEGSVGFYLFDLEGNFVSGAVFSSGWRCAEVTGKILSDGKTLQVKGRHNGTTPSGTEYVIKEGKLTYKASSPDRTAKMTLSEAGQKSEGTFAPVKLSLSGANAPGL